MKALSYLTGMDLFCWFWRRVVYVMEWQRPLPLSQSVFGCPEWWDPSNPRPAFGLYTHSHRTPMCTLVKMLIIMDKCRDNPLYRLGSSPSQEKSGERRTWDICSISNVTCKNWRENLLLFSTRKPRLRRKNPRACRVSKSVSPYFSLIFSRLFWPLACIGIFNPLRDELEPSLPPI